MKNNKLIVLIVLFSVMGLLLVGTSFAKYKSTGNIFSSSKSANMVYDLYVDPTPHINEYNYTFFSVYLRNYKHNNETNSDDLTDVNFTCRLNVLNKTSNTNDINYGYFAYKDSDGNALGLNSDNKPTLSQLTTNSYILDKTAKREILINIVVDTESANPQIVNYNLDLNCSQELSFD